MKENRFRPDANYWDQKLSNYLHDPPDKAICVPGHEGRSQVLVEALGNLPAPYKQFYQRADQIAAGMDRVHLPGYSPEASKNGAIDFTESPVLTHPTGEDPGVEYPGGISPPGPHGTGREPLSSSGSYCPAVGRIPICQ